MEICHTNVFNEMVVNRKVFPHQILKKISTDDFISTQGRMKVLICDISQSPDLSKWVDLPLIRALSGIND